MSNMRALINVMAENSFLTQSNVFHIKHITIWNNMKRIITIKDAISNLNFKIVIVIFF